MDSQKLNDNGLSLGLNADKLEKDVALIEFDDEAA